jgi:hypothetical protein
MFSPDPSAKMRCYIQMRLADDYGTGTYFICSVYVFCDLCGVPGGGRSVPALIVNIWEYVWNATNG